MGSDQLASFHGVVDSACGIKQDSRQEKIFSMYRFDVSFAVLTALFLPVTSTTSLRLQARQQAARQSGAITQASAINPWGSWVVPRGRQSMGAWIAPVLLLVRCLVRASIYGVVGSDPLASFHGVVDSACGITQDSRQEKIFSMYRFDVSFAVLTALFLPVTSTTSLRLQTRQQTGRQSGANTQG